MDAAAQAEVEKIQSAKELISAQQDLISSTQGLSASPQMFQGTPVGSATIIEGDEVTQISPEDVIKVLAEQRRAQGILSQAVPEMPVPEIQQFGEALQQSSTGLEQFDPTQKLSEVQSALDNSTQAAAEAQKEFADALKDFPPEYFKQLADGTKAVSEMQLALTDSTMKLIDTQDKLGNALSNLPQANSSREISSGQMPDTGLRSLSTSTQEAARQQDLLARTTRETNDNLKQISDIPRQKDSGFKFGFDSDVFSNIAEPLLGFTALLSTLGAITPIPAIKAGAMILGGAAGAGAAVGSFDKTHAPREVNQLQSLPADIDLSEIITPLGSIDTNVQSILQSLKETKPEQEINFSELLTPVNSIDEKAQAILEAVTAEQPNEADRFQELFGTLPNIEEDVKSILATMQEEKIESTETAEPQAYGSDRLQELFGTLPNIAADVQSILLEMQSTKELPDISAMPETSAIDYMTPLTNISGNVQSILQAVQTPLSFETIVTPLNNIAATVGNILSALGDREPPQINISPNNNIDLGGAYVFDNEMKKSLVDDITSQIVDKITSAVQQATSKTSYGYSA